MTIKRYRWGILALLLLIVSCTPPAGPPEPDPDPVNLAIAFTAPVASILTNANALSVALEVSGDTPELVELLLGGEVIAQLSAPYTYEWDISALTDGSYSLGARATLADTVKEAEGRLINIDRTAPQVTQVSPDPDLPLLLSSTIIISFSEFVKADNLSVKAETAAGPLEVSRELLENALRVQLAASPELPAEVTLTVSGISDLAGNPLAETSLSWQLPAGQKLGDSANRDPNKVGTHTSVAVDSAGQVLLAWLEAEQPDIDFGANPDAFDSGILPGNELLVARWDGDSWQALGGALNTDLAYPPSLVVQGQFPVVAWHEDADPTDDSVKTQIFVKRWNGSTWESLGGTLNRDSAEDASTPKLVLSENGELFVTWFEFDPASDSSNVYVAQWDGSAWTRLGEALNVTLTNPAAFPSISISSAGQPVVAWTEVGATRDLFVKRWDGTSWLSLGEALNVNAGARAVNPSIATLSGDTVVVTWFEITTDFKQRIYAKRWDGASWQSLGEVLNIDPENDAAHPVIATTPQGSILVSWFEFSDFGVSDQTEDVYLSRWDETAGEWQSVQGSLRLGAESKTFAYYPSLSTNQQGAALVAWHESTTFFYNPARGARVHVQLLNTLP